MAWVAFIPTNNKPINSKKRNVHVLNKGENYINSFEKEFKTIPTNLSEIRAYAKTKGKSFFPWDAYGQRLNYLNLGYGHWLLRSFGKDAMQNTLMSARDPLKSNINTQIKGVKESFSNFAGLFNPISLLGSFAPKSQWYASIYQDPISGASHLLVRHTKKTSYFMIAQHDTIEEFRWLPDGYRIAYTVTGSSRYKDGIYIWNLLTDKVDLVFPNETRAINSPTFASNTGSWHLSLAGIKKEPPTIYAFTHFNAHQPLAPGDFYKQSNLIAIEVEENKPRKALSPHSVSISYSDTNRISMLSIHGCDTALKQQQLWCNLPQSGNYLDVLDTWQSYAEEIAKTPIFPYTLWRLVELYSDAAKLRLINKSYIPTTDSPNADTLLLYGEKIATALLNQPQAPSWLRHQAWYAKQQFQQNNPLPYISSSLTLPVEGSLLDSSTKLEDSLEP